MTTKPFAPIPFGPYNISALLGRGASGAVYRAEHGGSMGFRRTVALKLLRQAADPDQLRALSDEARVGALFAHKNVVTVYDFGVVRDDHFYLAMEYVDGWPLDRLVDICRDTQLTVSLASALRVAIEICEGLAYLHTLADRDGQPLGLVHRDLKPANLLVDRTGAVRITDFGIARHTQRLTLTRDGTTKGTPSYMSPEQVKGEDLDARSDLFAMGSIFYELLSLNRAFDEDDSLRTLMSVIKDDMAGKVAEIHSIHPMAGAILERLWQRDSSARYQSAEELLLDLRELLQFTDNELVHTTWWASLMLLLPPERPNGFFSGEKPPEPVEDSTEEIHTMFVAPIGASPPAPEEVDEWDVPAPPSDRGLRQRARPAVLEEPRTVTVNEVHSPLLWKEPSSRRFELVVFAAALALVLMVGAVLPTSETEEPVGGARLTAVVAPTSSAAGLPSIMVEPDPPSPAAFMPARTARTEEMPAIKNPTESVSPALPEALPATLDLYTSPPADVVLGDRVIGRTPLEIEVPSGDYLLTLRCAVCTTHDHSLAVSVAPGGVFKKVLRLEEQY